MDFLGGLGRGSVRMTFPGSGGGGGGFGGGGGYPSFGTGPRQSWRRPGDFGEEEPSQDSLTRARFNEFNDYIENLNNKGAGARLEDAAAAGRSSVAENLARSGVDPGSLQGAMLAANAQAGQIDAAFGREAELDAQLKREQTGLKGQLAQMEQSRGNDLFDRWAGEQSLNIERDRLSLAQDQQDFVQSQANLQNIFQLFADPRFRELFSGGGGL